MRCIYARFQTYYYLITVTLLEEKVLYRTLKGSISATYLEPLKGSIQNPLWFFVTRKKVLYGTFWIHSFIVICFVLSRLNISYY